VELTSTLLTPVFSSVYAVWNSRKLWNSQHGFWRRLSLLFLSFFNFINIVRRRHLYSWAALTDGPCLLRRPRSSRGSASPTFTSSSSS
jgi:hypothetical protein